VPAKECIKCRKFGQELICFFEEPFSRHFTDNIKRQLEIPEYSIIPGLDGISINLLNNLREKLQAGSKISEANFMDLLVRLYFSI
jgi:hypothetical protein